MNDTQARGPRRWDAGNARPGKLELSRCKRLAQESARTDECGWSAVLHSVIPHGPRWGLLPSLCDCLGDGEKRATAVLSVDGEGVGRGVARVVVADVDDLNATCP